MELEGPILAALCPGRRHAPRPTAALHGWRFEATQALEVMLEGRREAAEAGLKKGTKVR